MVFAEVVKYLIIYSPFTNLTYNTLYVRSGWICKQGRYGMQVLGEVCLGELRMSFSFHLELMESVLL